MCLVGPPIVDVSSSKLLAPDNQQILSVPLLGRLGEVERPRDDDFAVDDHHFIVGDGMSRIDVGVNASLTQETGGGESLGSLTLVKQDLHYYATIVGSYQSLGDGNRGKRIGLDEDQNLCII